MYLSRGVSQLPAPGPTFPSLEPWLPLRGVLWGTPPQPQSGGGTAGGAPNGAVALAAVGVAPALQYLHLNLGQNPLEDTVAQALAKLAESKPGGVLL